jgi:replicative DNA helicase
MNGDLEKIILHTDDTIDERIKEYQEREKLYSDQAIVITGLPTGISFLDEVTQGIQPTDLVIIHGRTGVGKTQILCYIAHHMRRYGYKVLFVNREMDPKIVLGRIDALAAHFNPSRWRSGKLTQEEFRRYLDLSKIIKSTKGQIAVVDPTKRMGISDIKKIAKKYGCHVIIVDYLNRVTPETSNGKLFDNIREIADGLKDIAYNERIPVIAAAQTNRSAVLGKTNSVPGTEHVFGGDVIGWNADLVISLFQTKKMYINNKMGFHMAKYRHGEEVDILLNWRLKEGIISVDKIADRKAIEVAEEEEGISDLLGE